MVDQPHTERRIVASANYVGMMIITISAIAGLISLIVIGSVAFIAINSGIVPAVLSDWGGIILGFYFGSFVTLVNGYMGIAK